MEGVHIDLERLSEWVTFKTKTDYTNMIQRLNKFGAQADGIIGVLKAAVKEGRTYHAISMVSKDPLNSLIFHANSLH